MKREWKPGDVGLVPLATDSLAMWVEGRGWVVADGRGSSRHFENVRPLVVIDPEDRKQVTRLLASFIEAVDASFVPAHPQGWSVPSMQAALREVANPTPPKPDEPTGLGSVVEDDEGVHYVLVAGDDAAPWARVPADEWQIECFAWHEFSAVRVLSEGVTA